PASVFSSRRRHTRVSRDWSSDVCSSDLGASRRRPADRRAPVSKAPARSAKKKEAPAKDEALARKDVAHRTMEEAAEELARLAAEIGRASCREQTQSAVRSRYRREQASVP